MPSTKMVITLKVEITDDAPKGTLETLEKLIKQRLEVPIFAQGAQVTLKSLEVKGLQEHKEKLFLDDQF